MLVLTTNSPPERLGRVFGFAHSTTGAGVDFIGDWFGTGVGRGIALVFSAAGMVGLAVTLVARRSRSYLLLARVIAERRRLRDL